jgi:hypothetical protein
MSRRCRLGFDALRSSLRAGLDPSAPGYAIAFHRIDHLHRHADGDCLTLVAVMIAVLEDHGLPGGAGALILFGHHALVGPRPVATA